MQSPTETERRITEPTTATNGMAQACSLADIDICVYGDGIAITDVALFRRRYGLTGFTTNPTLVAQAGATDYLGFAAKFLEAVPSEPVSFEVIADDPTGMERQAHILSSLGDNVYVKIPVVNTQLKTSYELIQRLACDGIPLNITAVFTIEQIDRTLEALPHAARAVISIFAGRIADSGFDPVRFVEHAVNASRPRQDVQILWASCREVFNICQAAKAGCDIITVAPDLLKKTTALGKDLTEYSRETVEMFSRDAANSGFEF